MNIHISPSVALYAGAAVIASTAVIGLGIGGISPALLIIVYFFLLCVFIAERYVNAAGPVVLMASGACSALISHALLAVFYTEHAGCEYEY
ncbi:MAG: hypothetical protein KTR20_00865 [Cellvibrionaceae bacterium]|nr:hypothetical protein [Cellvibrionaceae bacterium]